VDVERACDVAGLQPGVGLKGHAVVEAAGYKNGMEHGLMFLGRRDIPRAC
jgi:hypothetical protein